MPLFATGFAWLSCLCCGGGGFVCLGMAVAGERGCGQLDVIGAISWRVF